MIECLCLDVDEPGPAVCATSTRTAAIRRDFLSCGWTYGMLWQDLWDAFGGDDDAEDWLG